MSEDVIQMGGMGFTNPVRAAAAAIRSGMGVPIDEASFERVAEIVGDSPPEVLEQGFIICGINELQRLCSIGHFVIATPPDAKDGSPIHAYTAREWLEMQGRLQ